MQTQKQRRFLDLSGLWIVLVLIVSGCATQNKSAGLGGLIGATGGAAIGGIADPGKNVRWAFAA